GRSPARRDRARAGSTAAMHSCPPHWDPPHPPEAGPGEGCPGCCSSAPPPALFKIVAQRDRVVVLGIPRRENQRERPAARDAAQGLHCIGASIEFVEIAPL